MNTFPESGRRGRIARGLLLMAALTAALMVVAVACGSDDDNENEGDISRTPVMMTFTPTTEADATNRVATQEAMEAARNTAVAATATWIAENPPPPTNTPDPNATPEDEGLRPPLAYLIADGQQLEGAFGNFSFVDMNSMSNGTIEAPFYDVMGREITVSGGTELTFELRPAFMTPTTMEGEPASMNVEIYTWEGNNAIPTGLDGSVGTHPFFVPGTPPLLTQPLHVDQPVFTMPAAPNHYVVRVQVTWPTGTAEENPPQQDIYAFYAFTVHVR